MPKIVNLADTVEKQLPARLVHFMRVAGEIAYGQGHRLYLVGGVVRDLLLERTNLDLDLVVEGDAMNLARQLTQIYPGRVITHPCFNTAKLQWDKWSVDLATARSETYAKPGVLPSVKPGSLESDLSRRDFTINTMAVYLNPGQYGELIDLHGGMYDLEHKLIRILHKNSFTDDATRIWRGLRYEQRLDFQLEPTTLQTLKRDIPMLDTISGDRIRHELELILQEEFPEKILRRAAELDVLQRLHSSLKGNGWLAEKFGQARESSRPDLPSVGLYLALLTYRLIDEEIEQLIAKIRLPKSLAQTVRDTASIKTKIKSLTDPELTPSNIYRLLHGYTSTAMMANSLASSLPIARQNIQLFLAKLRYIKPALTGDDLKGIGITPGPRIKEILNKLHEARLDGKVKSKRGEAELVREWLEVI